MRNLIIILSLFIWTQVQAQGQYNSQERGYEMTYEDLVQELSAKKKQTPEETTQALGFEKIQAIFGYSFSSMDFNLPSGGSSFTLNGIDVRANGKLINSNWELEGGFKNFGKVSSGSKSAETRILTTALKNQGALNTKLQYVAGVSSSLHFISAKDLQKSKNEIDLSLNVTAGLRGPLSNQLSWGVDLNAYSPISGKLLKSGLDATLLLSSVL
jgi:hypothetical protein